ncbi:MAG: bifunctional glutamate N-acetyltransferase/amino-acid acetyltransferase ArgJ [Ardenticatenaceae bacterium]|nr:bifunctional glutamate N-acetyltransferase/amino-acid acetyltransferase ArgJ [Ardenticatenaceae bacterium]
MEDDLNVIESGTVTSPAGFRAAALAAHIKYANRLDLAVIVSDRDCAAAGVFTQNQVAAAPVLVDKETLAKGNGRIRAIIANAGNANASTGKPGLKNARDTQQIAAASLGCTPEQVLILSTGVIGVQLPMNKLQAGIETAANQHSPDNGLAAAQAIMTTDTHPKHLAVQVELPGGVVTIGGMAKGSGMIHPNMATMLGVVTTDALVAPELLQGMLGTAVNASFNRISVDGDTSTNDTVLLLANGASGVPVNDAASVKAFQTTLTDFCIQLAQMIVRDGEGASKFVEIQVTSAKNSSDAHAIAATITTSPLVKTAFAGSDANWGRILAAAGRAGVTFDQNLVELWIGINTPNELQLVAQGTPTNYQEADAARIFAQPTFKIRLDLGIGTASDMMWTSDLTHEYVSINADYRT